MVRQNRARLDRCLLPSTGLRLWRGEVLPGVDEPVASIAALLVATAVQIGGYLRAARTVSRAAQRRNRKDRRASATGPRLLGGHGNREPELTQF